MKADDLLSANDRDVVPVEVAGVTAYVRSLTAGEQLDMEAAVEAASGNIRLLLAAQLHAYLSDGEGNAILTLEQAQQFIDKRKPGTVRKIIDAAGGLNGWTKEAREAIRGN